MGKARPILFNAEMVRAILDGRKTQTRRVMKPQPILGKPWKDWIIDPQEMDLPRAYCPYGIPNDHLWVREGYQITGHSLVSALAGVYLADGARFDIAVSGAEYDKWRVRKCPYRATPGRFMYRSLSRIMLEVTGVRVERVQEITTQDVYAEGAITDEWIDWREDVQSIGLPAGAVIERERDVFIDLWESINKTRGYSWASNPWCWVVEWPQYKEATL